jgi:site-specific DNA recombinase
VLNEIEAQQVREIFELFRAHLTLQPVVAELRKRCWTNKSWTSKRGMEHTGRPFKKVSLRRLLTNAAYSGKVEYRGTIYEGEHPAIIEASVRQEVNARLRSERRGRGVVRVKQNALLGGLLYCKHCDQPMIPTYTKRRGLRFRYYVCKRAHVESYASCPKKSVAADRIETSVVTQLQSLLDEEQMRRRLRVPNVEWQSWLTGNTTTLLRGVVTNVSYDGTTGDIALKMELISISRSRENTGRTRPTSIRRIHLKAGCLGSLA